MFLHIGGDYTVSDKWIIGIFDLDKTTEEMSRTWDYLVAQEKAGRLEWIQVDLPRSFIVTLDRVYLSPINSKTLIARMESQREGIYDTE